MTFGRHCEHFRGLLGGTKVVIKLVQIFVLFRNSTWIGRRNCTSGSWKQWSNWEWIRQSLQEFWKLWELIASLDTTLPAIFKNIGQKHRLARKAEVVSQSQGWQLYGAASLGKKNVVNPWIVAPTMGFPPLTPSMTHFRPLHVWGHPPSSQPLAHMWPKHVSSPPGAPNSIAWSTAHHPYHTVRPPPVHPSFWQTHNNIFSSNSHVPRVPMPQEMYKAETKFGSKIVLPGKTLSQLPSHVHPSKESVDAAIGDVLSKPWMPLPLGLKPPSMDSVMVELQRQGYQMYHQLVLSKMLRT